jgi:DNA-binding transcriptional LysR family regulator
MLIRRFDPTSLTLFVAVCAEKSITKAAEREHIAPSAVSNRIAELEEAVKATLLYRHQRGVTPTPAGECLLKHARLVLHSMEKMCSELSEYSVGLRGSVKIFANRSAIIQFLATDLSTFFAEHENVHVDLEEHISELVVEGVETGVADVGICVGTTDLKGLQSFPYRKDRLVAVVPQGHPLLRKKRLAFHETLEFDQVGLHASSSLSKTLVKSAEAAGKTINFRVYVTSFDAVCAMVQAGLGVGVMPELVINEKAAGVGLRGVALTDAWANRDFKIVCRKYDALQVSSRRFVDHLVASKDDEPADVSVPRRHPK